MAHYGMLRDYKFSNDVDDIRGSSLYGVDDEKLGKIDDVIFDHTSGTIRYAVVDSGGWLSSKKFLVPADRIRADEKHDNDFHIDMTKEQIEALPRYDEDSFKHDKDNDDDRAWSDYDERYRKSLETTGDVLHREGSTHTITPDPSQMPATGSALPNESSLEPERVAGIFNDPTPNSNRTRMRPSGIAARAEDSALVGQSVREEMPTTEEEEALDRRPVTGSMGQTYDADRNRRLSAFENHLRRNRVDITSTCRSCEVKRVA